MERYRSIIPDYERFREIASTPPPVYIRVNTLRADGRVILQALEEAGWTYEPVFPEILPWHFRIHPRRTDRSPEDVARTTLHWAGWFYIQDIASGLVTAVLNPSPGSILLDLCAAPGGKTTHSAQLMQNHGKIVANDIGTRRLRALQTNLLRMGVACAVVTRFNGLVFPEIPSIHWTHILVDAPCSGEGRIRESSRWQKASSAEPGFICQISGTQKGLLRRAIQIASPGTRIVYATCTFAPEENEMVVSYVLEREPVRLLPIHLKDIPVSPGITHWEGKKFLPEVEGCVRIYPHQIDGGGMFIALLERM